MSVLKKKIYDIKKRLGLLTIQEYRNHLQDIGIKVGEHTKFFSRDIIIDEQRPWMIEIGDYCKITKGVIILQHDYSRSVLRRRYGEVIGESKKTTIGNNVFIGMNSVILMGTKVGDNVIIGAGSVVSGTIPNDVVIAGNPARVIKSLDEFYLTRKSKMVGEAKETFLGFCKAYGREPSEEEMGAFWPLYMPKNRKSLLNCNINTNYSGDNAEEIVNDWLKSNAPTYFDSYLDFKKFCYNGDCKRDYNCDYHLRRK